MFDAAYIALTRWTRHMTCKDKSLIRNLYEEYANTGYRIGDPSRIARAPLPARSSGKSAVCVFFLPVIMIVLRVDGGEVSYDRGFRCPKSHTADISH
jgi:hypothetical protein